MTDYEVKNRRAFEFAHKASNAAVGIARIITWPFRAFRDVLVAIDRTWRGRCQPRSAT